MADIAADIAALEEALTTPTPEVISDVARLEGDIVVLGVGGKVGPSVAGMAARAVREAGVDTTVYGVARFSDPAARATLEQYGVVPVPADLTDDEQLAALPDAANVIYMAGNKFGTVGNEHFTWMMNAYLPGRVAQRYRDSRIVSFSTLVTYPLADVATGGSREADWPGIVGEYAASCVGRERMFEHFSAKHDTPGRIVRLNYAIDMRYGVVFDVASKVHRGDPVDVTMGFVNVIWQGDANAQVLRCLAHCTTPTSPINVTGPETISIRWLAHQLAARLDTGAEVVGQEAPTALLSDTTAATALFGYPVVPLGRMLDWVADWVKAGGTSFGKPTKFEVRDGEF